MSILWTWLMALGIILIISGIVYFFYQFISALIKEHIRKKRKQEDIRKQEELKQWKGIALVGAVIIAGVVVLAFLSRQRNNKK